MSDLLITYVSVIVGFALILAGYAAGVVLTQRQYRPEVMYRRHVDGQWDAAARAYREGRTA